jgi:hypothetical protein
MSIKINCLSCGFKIDLDDAYDDYEGQVKCLTCHALLDIRLDQGNIRGVKIIASEKSLQLQEQ